MAGRHPVALIVENSHDQNGGRVRDVRMPFQGTLGQAGLDGVERGAVEDRLMLAGMNFATVGHVADVEAVLEEMRERANAISPAPHRPAACEGADLRGDVAPTEFLRQGADRAAFEIEPEHGADRLGLLGHDDQLLADAGIAERDGAADPNALALRGRNLVPAASADALLLCVAVASDAAASSGALCLRQKAAIGAV